MPRSAEFHHCAGRRHAAGPGQPADRRAHTRPIARTGGALSRGSTRCPTTRRSPARSVIICSGRSSREADAGEQENPEIAASRLAAVVFTSGSTGEPVAHHKLWGALAERSIDAAACFGMTASSPGQHRRHGAAAAHVRVRDDRAAAAACACLRLVRRRLLSRGCGSRPARRARAARAGHHAAADPRPAAGLGRIAAARAHHLRHRAAVPRYGRRRRAALEHARVRDFRRHRGRLDREPAHRRGRRLDHLSPRQHQPRHARRRADRGLVSGPFADPHELSDMVEMLDAHHFRLLGRRSRT